MTHCKLYFLTFFLFPVFSEIVHAENDTVFMLFAGDIMQHKTQIDAVAKADGSFDYEPCFRLVKNEISSADLSVGNFETTLSGKPYSGYPQFSAPDQFAVALKELGFDVLLTANNHSLDKGTKGAKRTLKVFDSLNIQHTGMFFDDADRSNRYPLIVTVKNIKTAILNYTYGTNGFTAAKPFTINLIDSAKILEDIKTAKRASPDLIIACMHWGSEYTVKIDNYRKQLTEMLFAEGVNLVIGSHPHVVQPMEKRYLDNGRCNRLVAYSLGNFVTNQPVLYNADTEGGAMLKVAVVKDSAGAKITGAEYALVWVYKPRENGRTRHYMLPVADYENNTEMLDASFQKAIKTFAGNVRKMLNKENIGIGEYRIVSVR